MSDLSFLSAALLLLALGLALAFEFVNGFHDTANAVATVIYTHTLPPRVAVAWSGLWNLIGVLMSSGAVAFSVIALLPADLLLQVGSSAGFAMVFSMLLASMMWNLGTWYLGLPASSSHTLIGAILGVGLSNALLSGQGMMNGVNWGKARDVMLSLLVSPLVGFVLSYLLLRLARRFLNRPELFRDPSTEAGPPRWIRSILFMTCTGVSFAHGSNDGQKGMGLLLLILIGILPAQYAVNLDLQPKEVAAIQRSAQAVVEALPAAAVSPEAATSELKRLLTADARPSAATLPALRTKASAISATLVKVTSLKSLSQAERSTLRQDSYLLAESARRLRLAGPLTPTAAASLARLSHDLESAIQYIPLWVKIAVALALSLGTMIGWERIVITVGEKIGKSHLSYAQGAVAEGAAMSTILAADALGLPLSTTHVLSSGIAGTMVANHSGLQRQTVRNVMLAWVLTLPVCVFLGAVLFALGLNLILAIGL